MLVSLLGTGTISLSVFTDSDTSAGSFTTGTLDLDASPSTIMNVTGMIPGDSTTQNLTLDNAGTVRLRYALTSISTNADSKGLRDQLDLTIKTQGTNCSTFDGTTLYSGTLNGATFGDTTQGGQTGDRELAGGTSEVLCFRVRLPIGTGNGFQDAATSATFTFSAEQTGNNP